MQTAFTDTQLADPDIAEANQILRTCVHCGFCTATCPTYVLLGDELDSPRGRIYLIKDMLENDRPADEQVVTHVDRCLSCLSCMSTCPSGVDYMHLVDQARARIERTYRRHWHDRALRDVLCRVLPHAGRFRLALLGAMAVRRMGRRLPGRIGALFALAPDRLPGPSPLDRPWTFPACGPRRGRVALLTGCAQRVLRPAINDATVRLLTRHGFEVEIPKGLGCCGALVHHLGREDAARTQARTNIAAVERAESEGPLDAVVINASGCGTMVKDYGHLLRGDPSWAARGERVAGLARDLSEILDGVPLILAPGGRGRTVAYHSACSMQHGQGLKEEPRRLLEAAGFTVTEPREAHLCCGSAGTYNLLQPDIAGRLRTRKAGHLDAIGASVVATGNIGCLVQLTGATHSPVVHTAELLDWATGGPMPPELGDR